MGPTLLFRSLALAALAALAACGGGGGGSAALPATPATLPAVNTTAPQSVQIAIAIPSDGVQAASTTRRPAYISSGTKSAVISVGGTSTTVDCNGSCSTTMSVQPGVETFSVALYGGTGGSGPMLSTGTTTTTIVAGQANTVAIVFGGVAARVVVKPAVTTVAAGAAQRIPVSVQAVDGAGYTIVGSDPYAHAITLTSDATSAPVTTATIDRPQTTTALAYDGSASPAVIHLSATIAGTSVSANAAITVTTSSAPSATSAPTAAPVAAQSVPAHAKTWYYYGLNNVNASIPAAWMAAHADFVEDDGFAAEHAMAFKAAGGRYAVSYTDPAYVPYCHAPFVQPAGACDGPIGNHLNATESAWLHTADGGRVHHYVSAEFDNQEALNPGSPDARAAYTAYTQRLLAAAPKVDYFFADDYGGAFLGSDGTQMTGWFYGYNAPVVEYSADATFLADGQKMLAAALKPVFINGFDMASGLPAYNGAWLDGPNVTGQNYEGCLSASASGGGVGGDNHWRRHQNGLLLSIAHRRSALCMMTADSTSNNRLYLMASWWLTYDPTYSVVANLAAAADGFTVRQEYDIVPTQPRSTAAANVDDLKNGGAYVREFKACYQGGSPIGPCATIVNASTTGSVAMPALSGSYTRVLAIDNRSAYGGGTVTWGGSMPSTLGALSAIIVR